MPEFISLDQCPGVGHVVYRYLSLPSAGGEDITGRGICPVCGKEVFLTDLISQGRRLRMCSPHRP